jgi:hypothetical protein
MMELITAENETPRRKRRGAYPKRKIGVHHILRLSYGIYCSFNYSYFQDTPNYTPKTTAPVSDLGPFGEDIQIIVVHVSLASLPARGFPEDVDLSN